jgi:hypothetical protein
MRRLIFALLLLPAAVGAQEQVRYEWTAPTTGSAVDHYVVEVYDGAAWGGEATTTETSAVVEMENGWTVRVAGVDSYGRQGPWSEPSDPFADDGAPGAPGKPSMVTIVLGFLGVLLIGLIARRKEKK